MRTATTSTALARALLLLVLGLGSLAASAAAPTAAAASAEHNPVAREPAGRPVVTGRVILGWRGGAADADRASTLAARTRLAVGKAVPIAPQMDVVALEGAKDEASLAAALAVLRADPQIAFAEPDRRRYRHLTPNDPLFSAQWYLQSAQPSATGAATAWEPGTGNNPTGSDGVVVAVLDTGVRFDHPDLKRAAASGRLLPGYDFVSGDGNNSFKTANDGDGRDADPTDPGDWVTSAEATGDCPQEDSSWHGTRVSGIIGALADNATGLAGLTWRPWLLPVRVLGKCGGYDSDIIAGMRWAAGLSVGGVAANPYPARILNLSLGGSGACSASYQSAIDELVARGVVVIASAGNESGPVSEPANCRGVVSVVALRHVGTKVGFSNLGAASTIGAPGGNCVNIGAGEPCLFSIDTTTNAGRTTPGADSYTDQFNFNVGTSFSAPIVAGVAALMLSVNGNLSSAQVTARLREGATPYPAAPAGIPLCRDPTGPGDLQSSECACTAATCGAGMATAVGAVRAARRPVAALALPASVSAGQNFTVQGGVSAASCGRSVSTYAWSVVEAGTGGAIVSGDNAATVQAV
ncbi:MAG: S8 family peptidase, partial [Gammaproteobacteria bacterium]